MSGDMRPSAEATLPTSCDASSSITASSCERRFAHTSGHAYGLPPPTAHEKVAPSGPLLPIVASWCHKACSAIARPRVRRSERRKEPNVRLVVPRKCHGILSARGCFSSMSSLSSPTRPASTNGMPRSSAWGRCWMTSSNLAKSPDLARCVVLTSQRAIARQLRQLAIAKGLLPNDPDAPDEHAELLLFGLGLGWRSALEHDCVEVGAEEDGNRAICC